MLHPWFSISLRSSYPERPHGTGWNSTISSFEFEADRRGCRCPHPQANSSYTHLLTLTAIPGAFEAEVFMGWTSFLTPKTQPTTASKHWRPTVDWRANKMLEWKRRTVGLTQSCLQACSHDSCPKFPLPTPPRKKSNEHLLNVAGSVPGWLIVILHTECHFQLVSFDTCC